MKPGLLRIVIAFFALLLLLPENAHATHLRAGEITVRRDACNSLKFWITITVFTNTKDTQVLFGGPDDILDFGDGSDPDGDGIPGRLVPETRNTERGDLGVGIATASFTIDHIYAGGATYKISYTEPNRNEGVVNMDGSVNTRFYIETEIVVKPTIGCNENTPVLAVPPIDRGCTGVAWFHNPGAYDLDGDSLSYQMVVPFRERDTEVLNYKSPIDQKFYPGNFDTGNEAGTGSPTFEINPIDGTITWDAPGTAGEYNIAFIIKEWRQIKGDWVQLGFVRRDMQIIIEECENNRPDLIVPKDVCVEAGTVLDATIIGTDPDLDSVKIEAFSEIFFLANAQSPATYTPNPPEFQSLPAQLNFQWKTQCGHVKDQPYQIVFKITDSLSTGPRLVTFKTWLIRVVGPKPQFPDDNNEAISTNLEDRSVTLTWEEYFCENAQSIQIWRRIDSLAFEPDTCQTGMPENLGYELIDTVPADGSTTYTDDNNGKGLASGAAYCYRLVAIFPRPRGGESPVSKEVCIPPILADRPIITKVSVLETDSQSGDIKISWVPPFEADTSQFPKPYNYKIFRAEGFSGQSNLVEVATVSDTTFTDTSVGLNTVANIYNYTVQAISANNNPMDTSAAASTVRLQAESQLNTIALTWEADVPWTNEVPGLKHRIFRGGEGATSPDQLELIAELDVIGTGFTYSDVGQHDSIPLVTGQTYCYVVETLGSYGNDDPVLMAKDPLRNFSQIVCSQPGDTIPPCKPLIPVVVNLRNCDEYINDPSTCNQNVFENEIEWEAVVDDCGNDVAFYYVYFTSTVNGTFSRVQRAGVDIKVFGTRFIHTGMSSYAGCYKISAVDRSGNESELSDAVCRDNCPYYELPNVFTPNSDDCNKEFSAYSTRDKYIDPETEGNPYFCGGLNNPSKCARFVNSVKFKVFNRWGKQVYGYESDVETENPNIYIDWDGRGSDGRELASGVYFYLAEVTFNTTDPQKANKTYKGWVHLLR